MDHYKKGALCHAPLLFEGTHIIGVEKEQIDK
jgi:hypothetical protein